MVKEPSQVNGKGMDYFFKCYWEHLENTRCRFLLHTIFDKFQVQSSR